VTSAIATGGSTARAFPVPCTLISIPIPSIIWMNARTQASHTCLIDYDRGNPHVISQSESGN